MYEHSKIYKLQCNDGYFYIGSTCNQLRVRLQGHKQDCKQERRINTRVYSHINNIGWDNVQIILIEEFACENKEQLRHRENEYIQRELNNELCLNIRRAFITDNERSEYNKDYMNKKRQNETYKEQHKKYMESYHEVNIEKEKEYRNKNKQHITKYSKEYYEQNKQLIMQKQRQYRLKKKAEKNNVE